MKRAMLFAASVALLLAIPALAETNAIVGRLGYPVGTDLIIEGTNIIAGKFIRPQVTVINDKQLRRVASVPLHWDVRASWRGETNITFKLGGHEVYIPDAGPGAMWSGGTVFVVTNIFAPTNMLKLTGELVNDKK